MEGAKGSTGDRRVEMQQLFTPVVAPPALHPDWRGDLTHTDATQRPPICYYAKPGRTPADLIMVNGDQVAEAILSTASDLASRINQSSKGNFEQLQRFAQELQLRTVQRAGEMIRESDVSKEVLDLQGQVAQLKAEAADREQTVAELKAMVLALTKRVDQLEGKEDA